MNTAALITLIVAVCASAADPADIRRSTESRRRRLQAEAAAADDNFFTRRAKLQAALSLPGWSPPSYGTQDDGRRRGIVTAAGGVTHTLNLMVMLRTLR